jgi:hypothetical protein
MKLLLLSICCVLLLAACGSRISSSVIKTDSTYTVVRTDKYVFDSIVMKPMSKLSVSLNLDSIKGGNVALRQVQGKDSLLVQINGSRLFVEANCAACEQRLKVLSSKYDSATAVKSTEKEIIKEPPEKVAFVPWYYYVLVGVLITIIVYLLIKGL